MKIKFFIFFLILMLFPHTFNAEPSYAKWGKIAVEQTKIKYPNHEIVDYLYIGKNNQQLETTEKFKLWLRNDTEEFGVFVHITFDSNSLKIIRITFDKTYK